MDRPLEIFFSYAHEDEELMNDVRRQLIVHERNGRILKWYDRMIPAGAECHNQIDKHLESADIVLLFLSPHFIESRYCYEVEGGVAIRKHESGSARTVPIILRPCSWEATPFAKLQALPRDAKPVTRWKDRDEACLDVSRAVMALVDDLSTMTTQTSKQMQDAFSNDTTPPSASANPRDVRVTYCNRCGQVTGKPSQCNGGYTHHAFRNGLTTDFCSRCGVHPGATCTCTGGYTHHEFINPGSGSVHCSRCGATTGSRSDCTGGYSQHSFVKVTQ